MLFTPLLGRCHGKAPSQIQHGADKGDKAHEPSTPQEEDYAGQAGAFKLAFMLVSPQYFLAVYLVFLALQMMVAERLGDESTLAVVVVGRLTVLTLGSMWSFEDLLTEYHRQTSNNGTGLSAYLYLVIPITIVFVASAAGVRVDKRLRCVEEEQLRLRTVLATVAATAVLSIAVSWFAWGVPQGGSATVLLAATWLVTIVVGVALGLLHGHACAYTELAMGSRQGGDTPTNSPPSQSDTTTEGEVSQIKPTDAISARWRSTVAQACAGIAWISLAIGAAVPAGRATVPRNLGAMAVLAVATLLLDRVFFRADPVSEPATPAPEGRPPDGLGSYDGKEPDLVRLYEYAVRILGASHESTREVGQRHGRAAVLALAAAAALLSAASQDKIFSALPGTPGLILCAGLACLLVAATWSILQDRSWDLMFPDFADYWKVILEQNTPTRLYVNLLDAMTVAAREQDDVNVRLNGSLKVALLLLTSGLFLAATGLGAALYHSWLTT